MHLGEAYRDNGMSQMTSTRQFRTFSIWRLCPELPDRMSFRTEARPFILDFTAMTPKHIVIVGYDDITSLDLSGPLEAFSSAQVEDSRGRPQPCYRVTIAALGAKTFRSESGLRMTASCFLSSLRHLDTLIIPGGRGMRTGAAGPKLARLDQSKGERCAPDCVGLHRHLRRRAHRAARRTPRHHSLEVRRLN